VEFKSLGAALPDVLGVTADMLGVPTEALGVEPDMLGVAGTLLMGELREREIPAGLPK
jgi:hypothetical protein